MTESDSGRAARLLVTGATGGMGRTCALLAAGRGYDLALADLSQDRLEELAARCSPCGVAVSCHCLDVTRPESRDQLVAELEQAGGVDALIHTVGLSPQMAGWKEIIDVDLVGTAALLEQLRPHLKSGGCAVSIASMSGYLCPPDVEIEQLLAAPLTDNFLTRLEELAEAKPMLQNSGMAYAYAKKALKHYVSDRAFAWGSEGKRIVSISPGMINTEMGQLENAAMENYEAMRSRIALDRLGEAEDIAETALFLVSDKAAYITGCDILVDGGFVARFTQEQRQ
jgi:NAD(P)-dependent dehydrogenase (short-subunit alcohol dehydrogenase family)